MPQQNVLQKSADLVESRGADLKIYDNHRADAIKLVTADILEEIKGRNLDEVSTPELVRMHNELVKAEQLVQGKATQITRVEGWIAHIVKMDEDRRLGVPVNVTPVKPLDKPKTNIPKFLNKD